jgi:hypothetical protein
MADCGLCGRDVSTCSCDFGVIQNAIKIGFVKENSEQQYKEGNSCWQATETSRSYCDGKGREEQ